MAGGAWNLTVPPKRRTYEPPKVLTVYEAATALGVPVDAIRRLVMDGRLDVIDLGHRHRYIDPRYPGIVAGMLGVPNRTESDCQNGRTRRVVGHCGGESPQHIDVVPV